jgi:uncharacterized membrane protein YbhN (UPF0104 family)
MVVLSAVTLAVLLVVFVGILPTVADYAHAWSSIQQMPTVYVVGLVVATAVYLAAYVWPLQAALPGLGYGRGFVVGQTAFAISNAVPAGGAVGLGVQYGMLESYGFGAGTAAGAIAIVSSFNVFATLAMPVLGVAAPAPSGSGRTGSSTPSPGAWPAAGRSTSPGRCWTSAPAWSGSCGPDCWR